MDLGSLIINSSNAGSVSSQTLPKPGEPRRFDLPVEGLRGLAALVVVCGHLFSDPKQVVFGIDAAYSPPLVVRALNQAHAAVLIFFLLSGYVIGLSHRAEFTRSDTWRFFKRRLIRIYPIYVIAIAFSVAVYFRKDSVGTIAADLVFMQWISGQPPPSANPALWTLSCEMVYYALFPLLMLCRLKPSQAIFAAAIGSVVFYFVASFPDWISAYLTGWVFWLMGWGLCQMPQEERKNVPLASVFAFVAAFGMLTPGSDLFHGLHLLSRGGAVSLADLFLLPPLAVAFGLVAGRKIPWQSLLIGFSGLIVAAELALLIKMHVLLDTLVREEAVVLLMGGIFLLSVRSNRESISRFAGLGKISYALYAMHMPLMVFFRLYLPQLDNGSVLWFGVMAAAYITVALTISWLLEIKLQPMAKSLFTPRTRHGSNP